MNNASQIDQFRLCPVRRSRTPIAKRGGSSELETAVWYSRIHADTGLLMPNSVAIADAFVRALKATSMFSKIVYFMPILGLNARAATQPLIDTLNVGAAGMAGFSNGNVTSPQTRGMQGDGSSKMLDLLIKPSQLGSSNNGGMGWWELEVDNTGSTYAVMGCSNTVGSEYFTIRNYSSTFCDMIWGVTANTQTSSASEGGNGHVYGQRSSSTLREIFFNGVSKATTTTSDTASGAADRNIRAFGWDVGAIQYAKNRAACFYLTDGTLTSTEIALLHDIIYVFIIRACGKE